jgi:hypothetical protein
MASAHLRCRQTPLIKRLTKVTNNPVVHSAGVVKVVGVGSNEDRRNRVTLLDEVFMELDPGHRWHMDVMIRSALATTSPGAHFQPDRSSFSAWSFCNMKFAMRAPIELE